MSADYARQVDTVQLRLAQIEATQAEVAATVRRLEEAQRTIATRPASADGDVDSGTVRSLRGEIEVLQFELRKLTESIETLALDMDTRLLWQEQRATQLERALGLTPPPIPVGGVPMGPDPLDPDDPGSSMTDSPGTGDPGSSVVAPSTAPASAESLMELAMTHMTEGRQAAARAVLQRLLTEYPSDERVAEATYRVAETFFNEEKWVKAVTEFQKVVDRFPRHELASWAMLRQGEAFQGNGSQSDAVLFWEGVVQRYPGTPAAQEARDLLR